METSHSPKIRGLLLMSALILLSIQRSTCLPSMHPLHSTVDRINESGAFIGLVMAYSTEADALQNSGDFVARPDVPFIDLYGRRFHIGSVHGVDVIYVMCGERRLNAGVTVQTLLDVFNLKGIVHYGTAGSADNSMSFGDVSVPKDVAFTGSWTWTKFGREEEESPELNFGAYNVPKGAENLLSGIKFKPEEFYSVGKPMEEVFWMQVDPLWLKVAKHLKVKHTASLPINFAESFPSINLNCASVKPEKLEDLDSASVKPEKLDDLDCASVNKPGKLDDINDNSTRENGNVDSGFCSSHPLDPPSPPSYEIPQTDFHDFQEDRSIEKFYKGQIWALYSDVDQFPKFYAKIKKVDVEDISITVSWIELCTQGKKDELMWVENDLPAACGRFKVNRETEPPFVTTDTFSHLVNAVQCGRRGDQYDIYPKSGEVWAIYKDWNVNWTRSDLTKCQYDVVEILSCVGSVIKVLMLTKVDPYTTVFMPEMKGGNEHMVEIPISENLRFSHQIPAFRLTDEADGALYGYWELDSASIPKDLM